MSKVLFRTNAGRLTGIGHLVRCLVLARHIEGKGGSCLFILDSLEPEIEPFLGDMAYATLYEASSRKLDARKDAQAFLEIAYQQDASWVVLDDYRLGDDWEATVREAGYRLAVIDDVPRKHDCDLILDVRWRGAETQTAYDHLVAADTMKLLGPEYALLGPGYAEITKVAGKGAKPFRIMLGVGGAGDASVMADIIGALQTSPELAHCDLDFQIVLGPLADDKDKLESRFSSMERVEVIVGKTDLSSYIAGVHLYIGAAGGIIYQLMAVDVPAITFSLAENQDNPRQDMVDLGHLFHLGALEHIQTSDFSAMVRLVVDNYERVEAQCRDAKIRIDGRGVERVYKGLFDGQAEPMEIPSVESFPPNVERWQLTPQYQIRSTTDVDLYDYLASRNLDANRKNMISTEEIPYVHHCVWWFGTKRESFLLSLDGTSRLYIWHELKSFEDQALLIGGWFVCQDDVGFQDAFAALDWQLKYCDEKFPQAAWVAVINRHNKYVSLMNRYFGFEEISPDHALWPAVETMFPDTDPNEFHYVIREAQA